MNAVRLAIGSSLLLLTSCAGGPAPDKPKPEPLQVPTLQALLEAPLLDDLDLRQSAPFRKSGNVRSTRGLTLEALEPRSNESLRNYNIRSFFHDGLQLLVWCPPAPATNTLGIALKTTRMLTGAGTARTGLKQGKRLGLIGGEGPIAGHLAFATDRADCLLAGPWLVMQFDSSLQNELEIGDGSSLGARGEAFVANKQHDAARSLLVALQSTDDQGAAAIAKRITDALAKENQRFEEAADKAWQKIEHSLLTGSYQVAIDAARAVQPKQDGLVDAEGNPLASVRQWPQRARQVLIDRLSNEFAGKQPDAMPCVRALHDCITDDWQGDGSAQFRKSTSYLASRVERLRNCDNPEGLAAEYSRVRYYRDSAASKWAAALMAAMRDRNRQLLVQASEAAPVGSLRRIACAEFATLNSAPNPPDVSTALKILAKLEKAKTPVTYLGWFNQRAVRARINAKKLDAIVLDRANTLADAVAADAKAKGCPISVAAWLLVKHAFTARQAPAPAWSSDVLTTNDVTDSKELQAARAVIAKALLEIAPLSKNESSTADQVLTGPLTRNWPLNRQLGLDIGPSSSLHAIVNDGIAEEKQSEDHLVTHTNPWTWQQRPAKRLLLAMNPLAMERMSTLFVGKELTAVAKELKQRYETISTTSEQLKQRGEAYQKQATAQLQAAAQFKRGLANGTIPPATAQSRARAIDARSAELEKVRVALQSAGQKLEADIKSFSADRLAYLNSKSEEQADKHAEIETQLAAAMNALIDKRLAKWSAGKPENDVLWMRWFLGRSAKDFPGIPDILPPHPKRIERQLDQDGARIFKKSGRGNIGKALADHWENMCSQKVRARAPRMRKLLDNYVQTFGIDAAFKHVYMKSLMPDSLRDEVLTAKETARFKQLAKEMMDAYNEHQKK